MWNHPLNLQALIIEFLFTDLLFQKMCAAFKEEILV